MLRPFAHPWVDETYAPMYVLRAPLDVSVKDMKGYCVCYERFSEHLSHRLGWVTDLSSLLSVGAVQRKLFFEAMNRQRPVFDRYAIALAVAAPYALHRGLAHLVNWISPVKQPMSVHAELYDAMLWMHERMAEASLHVTVPQRPR